MNFRDLHEATRLSRNFLASALTLVAVLLRPEAARADAWSGIEQLAGAAPVQVMVSGKPRNYFRMTAQTPLVIPVDGPTQLRFTSRVEVAANAGVVTYEITASEGAEVIEKLSTETSISREATLPGSNTLLAKSRRMTIDVRPGHHRVTLTLAGAAAVLVRIQKAGAVQEEGPMVTLTPVSASRSVSVSEGEKIIPYYTSRRGDPVRIRVVGPTVLDLMTRLDFDATMRGTAAYRLRILENRRVLRQVDFTTTKAGTATFTNLPDRVPSKFDRFQLPIGEGLHEIAIELIQPAMGAVEIHARIPQPTVGNEE